MPWVFQYTSEDKYRQIHVDVVVAVVNKKPPYGKTSQTQFNNLHVTRIFFRPQCFRKRCGKGWGNSHVKPCKPIIKFGTSICRNDVEWDGIEPLSQNETVLEMVGLTLCGGKWTSWLETTICSCIMILFNDMRSKNMYRYGIISRIKSCVMWSKKIILNKNGRSIVYISYWAVSKRLIAQGERLPKLTPQQLYISRRLSCHQTSKIPPPHISRLIIQRLGDP